MIILLSHPNAAELFLPLIRPASLSSLVLPILVTAANPRGQGLNSVFLPLSPVTLLQLIWLQCKLLVQPPRLPHPPTQPPTSQIQRNSRSRSATGITHSSSFGLPPAFIKGSGLLPLTLTLLRSPERLLPGPLLPAVGSRGRTSSLSSNASPCDSTLCALGCSARRELG